MCESEKESEKDKNQFGFLAGKSTSDAVTALVEKIIDETESDNYTLTTFLDLSSAFDCVDRGLLMEKLSNYGARGPCYDLIGSFLTERKQFVCLRNDRGGGSSALPGFSTSEITEVHYGVPQGAIFSPFLFLVYVNMFVQNNIFYADDATCLVSSKDTHELEKNMFEKVNGLAQSLATHNLMVNALKTASMFFNLKKKTVDEPLVSINDTFIENVDCFKVLGLHVDFKLKWTGHVDIVCSKICSGIFVLRNIVKVCSLETALLVYYALIESHIVYGIALWGTCNVSDMHKVFKLQKRAVRCLSGLGGRDSCREQFEKLNILTVPALYVFHTCLAVKKNPINYAKLGERHNYSTRHGQSLEVPRHSTALFERKPSYRAIFYYNKIPEEIKNKSLEGFKKDLKVYLLSKCLYSCTEF